MKNGTKKSILINIDEETKRELDAVAKADDRSVSWEVRHAVQLYLKSKKDDSEYTTCMFKQLHECTNEELLDEFMRRGNSNFKKSK